MSKAQGTGAQVASGDLLYDLFLPHGVFTPTLPQAEWMTQQEPGGLRNSGRASSELKSFQKSQAFRTLKPRSSLKGVHNVHRGRCQKQDSKGGKNRLESSARAPGRAKEFDPNSAERLGMNSFALGHQTLVDKVILMA